MTIDDSIDDPMLFKPWFSGPSWDSWRTVLRVLFALSLSDDDIARYGKHTQRQTVPTRKQIISTEKHGGFREAWFIVGRRGGKSLIASLIAVFLACFRDYSAYLKPGEIGTVMLIAADRKQARVLMRYVKGFLALPMLHSLVVNETQESVELSNHISIEIHTASFRTVRGYTIVAAILDEVCFWRDSEGAANPASEILASLMPATATIPEALVLGISSPYARSGLVWDKFDRHFGRDDSTILVWRGTSAEMNPSIDPAIIQQALEEDPSSARAEYFAEFRTDVESYIALETIERVMIAGRTELRPVSEVNHIAFIDAAGGSGSDSMTLGIAHREKDQGILDFVSEIRPPFSPEAAVEQFCEEMRRYEVRRVIADRYGSDWVAERFRNHGFRIEPSALSKSEIYAELIPILNSSRCELLDLPRLKTQLQGLERRPGSTGDHIDHELNSHDDVVNSAAGSIVFALRGREYGDHGISIGVSESTQPAEYSDPIENEIRRLLRISD